MNYLLEKGLDILAVIESWANDNIADSELQINGYTLYRKDRNSVRDDRGGGVLLYIKSEYTSCNHDKLNSLSRE